jgi:hypothetical protein
MKNLPRSIHRALHILLLAAAAVLLGLHFTHLTADFPNYSAWMDWSKYTDEGWYGDAAIRHFQLGHWYVKGDFNPAAALPVWPFFEALIFQFTGVSLTAARALTVCVFAGILVASWFLVARHSPNRSQRNSLAASIAVLLLAANPFCFVFTRLAITEPLVILFTLLALLVIPPNRVPQVSHLRPGISDLRVIFLLGILLPALILTKTTAIFLTPAIFWMLFASCAYRAPAYLRIAVPAALLALALWLSYYYFGVVRPGHLLDYRYLFSANAYTAMTRENFAAVIAGMLKDGRWIGYLLYPLAIAAAAIAVSQFRRLAAYPLIPALMLWVAGYMAFLAYHNNLQPRYYLVIAIPLTLLLPVVVEDLMLPRIESQTARRVALATFTLTVTAIVLSDARHTISFVRHPEYTLVRAAEDIATYIRHDQKSDPTHKPLILSISGSDISLITGLPSICDDFGTLDLIDRVKLYKPGWYVAWNQLEDDKMDAMSPMYSLQRVGEFPAMDDPDRNLLILYKLYPAGSQPPHPQHKKAIPRRLRTPLGQQPSVEQLRH